MSAGKAYRFNGSKFQVETTRAASKQVTAISKAAPGVLTVTAHGYVVGQTVYIDVDDGMPEFTPGEYVVASVPSANTFTVTAGVSPGVDTTNYSTFVVNSPNTNTVAAVTFTDMCELTGYQQQGGQTDQIETTGICDTAKQFVAGLPDTGTLSLDFNAAPNTPVQKALDAAALSGASIAFRLVFPNGGGTVIFFGSVQSTSMSGANGGKHEGSASIKLSGNKVVLA